MNAEQKYAMDTALVLAASRGYRDIVKELLKAGADIHVNGDAPLLLAAENGHSETVQLLLDRGADPQGHKALLLAAQHDHMDTLKVLFNWAEAHQGQPPSNIHRPSAGPTI